MWDGISNLRDWCNCIVKAFGFILTKTHVKFFQIFSFNYKSLLQISALSLELWLSWNAGSFLHKPDEFHKKKNAPKAWICCCFQLIATFKDSTWAQRIPFRNLNLQCPLPSTQKPPYKEWDWSPHMNTLRQMKNASIAWICAPNCISTNRKMQERERVRKGNLQMHVHCYSSYLCKLSFI